MSEFTLQASMVDKVIGQLFRKKVFLWQKKISHFQNRGKPKYWKSHFSEPLKIEQFGISRKFGENHPFFDDPFFIFLVHRQGR